MTKVWSLEEWESGRGLPPCLTVRETAAALNTTPKTVYRMIRSGSLPLVVSHTPLRVPTVAVRKVLGFDTSTTESQ